MPVLVTRWVRGLLRPVAAPWRTPGPLRHMRPIHVGGWTSRPSTGAGETYRHSDAIRGTSVRPLLRTGSLGAPGNERVGEAPCAGRVLVRPARSSSGGGAGREGPQKGADAWVPDVSWRMCAGHDGARKRGGSAGRCGADRVGDGGAEWNAGPATGVGDHGAQSDYYRALTGYVLNRACLSR